jgi:hypothetical protein
LTSSVEALRRLRWSGAHKPRELRQSIGEVCLQLGLQLGIEQPGPDAAAMISSDIESALTIDAKERGAVGNRSGLRGVARANIEDGSFEAMFPELPQPAGMLAMDATTVYWAAPPEQPDGQLWRGNKDGSGQPMMIAHGWQYSTGLTQNASGIYWTVPCGPLHHLIRSVR